MKRTLFILVAASALGSGAAFAGMPNGQSGEPSASVRAVPVQYYERHDYNNYSDDRSATRSSSITERETRMRDWIERSANDGRLRPWQARRLQRELGEIQDRQRTLEADGRLDGREFAELNRDLQRLADHIRDEMGNDTPRF